MATIQEMLLAKGLPVAGATGKSKKAAVTAASHPAKYMFKMPPSVPEILTPQTQEERFEAAEALRKFRGKVVVSMHEYVGRIRAIDALVDEDEQAMEAGFRKQLSDAVAQMLSYEPPFREPAVLAYADALVKTCPEFRGSVESTLKALVEVGFLLEVAEGRGNRIYGKDYKLAKDFERNADAKAVGEALSGLVSRTVAAGKERFETDHKALKAAVGENPLTVTELKAGKEGRMLLETPDHKYRDRFYKGGILLLESSKGGQIRALDGVGGCQRVARQVAESGVFVWNTQVAFERMPPMNERLPEETFRNVLILHGLVYRGVAAAEKAEAADGRKEAFKAQTAAEREALKGKATLSQVEFFLFVRAGTTVLDPLGRKPFEIRSQVKGEEPTLVWDVIALVERDEQGRIRVADCPERLAEFFAKHREFVPAGEKFAGISWPLNVLLRMGYAAAQSAASAEQKAEAQAASAKAEADRKAAEAEANKELAAQLGALAGEDLSGVNIPDPNEGR